MSTGKRKQTDTKVGKTKTRRSHDHCALYTHEAGLKEAIVAINYGGNTHLVRILNVRGRTTLFLQLRTLFTNELAGEIADYLTE